MFCFILWWGRSYIQWYWFVGFLVPPSDWNYVTFFLTLCNGTSDASWRTFSEVCQHHPCHQLMRKLQKGKAHFANYCLKIKKPEVLKIEFMYKFEMYCKPCHYHEFSFMYISSVVWSCLFLKSTPLGTFSEPNGVENKWYFVSLHERE
jgi:hypothetical protein